MLYSEWAWLVVHIFRTLVHGTWEGRLREGFPSLIRRSSHAGKSIEEQVRAGNVPGVVAPTNDPTVPPPPGAPPPPPGAATITNVGDQTAVVVPTDPNAAPGTVPPTVIDTG